MIAATNRLKDYPTRIVYREVQQEEREPTPLFWLGLIAAGVAVWVFAIIGIGTVAGWMV